MAKKSTSIKSDPSAQPLSVTPVTAPPSPVEAPLPNGVTQSLGKGLWGIVGSKTRYSTITQFSGLEYVRYEYRRIPEEFRDAAFKSTYLDVVEIFDDLPVTATPVVGAEAVGNVEADEDIPADPSLPAEG